MLAEITSKMKEKSYPIDPATGSPMYPHIPGYDAQAARINANHVTAELSKDHRHTNIDSALTTGVMDSSKNASVNKFKKV